jgi:hypothetical protein
LAGALQCKQKLTVRKQVYVIVSAKHLFDGMNLPNEVISKRMQNLAPATVTKYEGKMMV